MGTPLSDVTFCVLDLETTGGSMVDCGITEVGAVLVRRGAIEGTFQTLVDPGRPVPAFIRLLTGISDDLLADAPPIESVLPSLLEFVKGSVIVAHNARFDTGFINTALRRNAYPALTNKVLDTAILARKILHGEVPNNKLSTLADHLRCAHKPCHRAFADVLATVDVLHHLIERVAGFGVTTLEDFSALSSTKIDGTFSKIRLTDSLPHCAGVYRFLGPSGKTLYVGKATDIRSRVRSYFFGDPRRRMRNLLREMQDIRIERHATLLEAEVAEARAIANEKPPYNRRGKGTGGSWFIKVSATPKAARVAAARVVKEDGSTYLGPFPSMKLVRSLVDCMRDAAPIHRCTDPQKCRGCPFAEIGTCAGSQSERHRAEMSKVARGMSLEHALILDPLLVRLKRLGREERFEEAADLRRRASLLERSLTGAADVAALVAAGDVVITVGKRMVLIRNGRLVAACDCKPGAERAICNQLRSGADLPGPESSISAATQREAKTILSWLRRNIDEVKLLDVSNGWCLPIGARPGNRFQQRKFEVG
jgi:DNA polymerase-3 subunit epsilon